MKEKKAGRNILNCPKTSIGKGGWARKLHDKNMDSPIQTLNCF
jgi:hypothetical protein